MADKAVRYVLILAVLGGFCHMAAILLSTQQDPTLRLLRLATGAAITVLAISSLIVQRLFGSKPAVILFCGIAYLATTGLAIKVGTGIASPGNAVVLVLVALGGFVIGPTAGMVATILAIVSMIGLTIAQYAGLISGLVPGNLPPAITYTISYVIVFTIGGIAIYQFSKMFWQALQDLDQARSDMEEQVRELGESKHKLQDSERRLNALIDNTPVAILVFHPKTARLHYANQHALMAHHAHTKEELERYAICVEEPYSRKDWIQAITRVQEQGPFEQQWRTVNLSGEELWWLVKLDQIILDGEPYVAAFAENITAQLLVHQALIDEQFRLEEKVRERTQELMDQQRQLNAIIDALPDALSIKDTNGQYRMCNRVFLQRTGRRMDEIVGATDTELFDFSTAFAISSDDAHVLNSGQSKRDEQDIPDPDGNLHDYLVTKVPLLDDRQQPRALLTLATDISDLKTLQRDLQAATAQAERLARIKAEFLANMSHEIRTPLNGVLGLAHIGARDHAENAKAQAMFKRISRSGQHLLGVVNDILDFSKIDAGKMTVEQHELNPTQLADEAMSLLAERAHAKGLELKLNNRGVPEWVLGDSLRIKQILLNLLGNAVKFTEHGNVTLTLTQTGNQLHFVVQDSGIGMSPQMLARVFTPFEQADNSTTRQYGGTGLGLTISRQLARLMGGDITVQSAPGTGSTFTVTVPCLPCEAPPETDDVPLAHQHGDQALQGLRILAVDDVDVNRDILQSLLEAEGAETIFATQGAEALELVNQYGPDYFDVALMDVQMPVMDGLTATRHLATRAPHLPVIALTAHALPEERQRCLDAGMCSHLTKPIDPHEMVSEVLARARKQNRPAKAMPSPTSEPSSPSAPIESPAMTASVAMPTSPATLPPLAGADLEMALARCGGKDKILIKILQKFAQTQADFVTQFEALRLSDPNQARRSAHALKGTSANLGFAALSKTAAALEDAATQNDIEGIASSLQAVSAQLTETLANLNVWLEQQNENAGMAYNAG